MEFFETVMGHRFFEGQLPRLIKAIERAAEALEKSAAPATPPGDAAALDAIATVLHGQEWNADALVTIADAVRRTGRVVDDVDEQPAATE